MNIDFLWIRFCFQLLHFAHENVSHEYGTNAWHFRSVPCGCPSEATIDTECVISYKTLWMSPGIIRVWLSNSMIPFNVGAGQLWKINAVSSCWIHMSSLSHHLYFCGHISSAPVFIPLQFQFWCVQMFCHIMEEQSCESLGGLTSWATQSALILKCPWSEEAAQ